MASQNIFTKAKSPEGNRHELKIKVLTMILEFMKSNYGMQETNQIGITVKLEELHTEWQKKNPYKKFKDYKCGKTLKPFLIKECGLQESMLDEFEIVPAAINAKLQSMSDLPTQESDCERKAETSTKKCKSKKQLEVGVSESEPKAMASQSNLIKSNAAEGDKHELKVKVLTMILDLLRSRYLIEETNKIPRMIPLEELNTEWQKMSPNKKFKDYRCGRTLKQFLIKECELQESMQDEFAIVPAAIHAQLQSMSDLPTQESDCERKVDRTTKKWKSKKQHEVGVSDSELHYIKVIRVLFKCGLPALRDLFEHLHYGWSNSPNDIVKFDIGKVPLKHKDEIRRFNSGNIEDWDISLLSKVLLHQAKTTKKLSKEWKTAIELIRNIRNSVQGHSKSGKLTKHDYENKMSQLRHSVVKGLEYVTEEKFEQIIEEADSCKDNDFFNFYHQELLSEFSELKKMLQNIAHGNILQKEIYREGESQISNWYEWEDLRKKLDRLDTDKNQYILIVDKLSEEEDTSLRILKNVNWKVVVDVDPNSDNGGLLTQFKSVGATISTLLPNQLRGANTENLLQSNSIQWLQANGRSIELTDDQKANAAEVSQYNKDEPKDTIDNWERHFRVPCQEVIRTMGKKFDDMKLTYCLILGIRCGLSSEIATLISKDIRGQFEYMGHEINFVSIDSELALSNFPNLTCSDLSISHFLIGLAGLCGNSLVTKYSLPTGVKDCPVTLSPKHFSALNEYMEVLYHSCEDIPEGLDDAELESFEKQHLKNFISGSTITLQSLHFQHDARRDLTKEIYDDILSSYKAAQMAKIIQIKHTPGSGGTTLARRVLWDLHERLPCVIIRMDCALKNFGQYSYGETYIENLCKRISKLQSICKVSPVILMDGNSTQVSTLSSCVARKLRNTPLFILCCVKHKPRPGVKKPRKEQSKKEKSKKESNDDLFRREFELDYRLDRKSPEYSELKKIYQCYRTQFPEDSQTSTKLRERVFHFPMLALLGDFKKLSSIVSDSLDILKMHKEKEYEIAIVVAFLQQFGDVTTPVSLISKYILKSKKSYEKLASQFDENLMNLMVPGKPPGGKKFIANNYFKSSDDDDEETQQQCVIEYYTFQHHQVADAVLKYCQRSLHEITKDFLDYEILVCYRENKEITYVIDQLFLYHEAQNETHFSKLVSKLADWKRKKPEKNAQKNHKEEHDVEGFNVEEKNEEAEEYNEDESDAEEYYVMEKTAAARNEVVKSAEEKNVVEKNEEEKNEKDDNGNKKEGKNADQIEFDVGKIFEDAAEQTKDATFYSHVARFFSYNGNFVKARELIEKGMEVESNIPADRKRRIFDTYGYIVLKEMRSKNIKDIDDLQRDAEEAFTLFRKAKEIHPRNFPNPLIGTVKVWQFCFEYLIKEYENDVKKVIELTVEDGFFSNSIATCIDLLNEVDDMVKELQLLPDAERTKGLADWQRYMLAETFGKAKSATTRSGLGEVNFFRICEFIRSYKDTASQKYLIRLQAMWLISKVKRDFTRLEEMEKKQLFSWLEKLVIEHEMFSLTREMLDVAAIQNKPQIQIDRAFKIIEDWQDRYPNDHFSFFYQYMLCFIKICEGKITDHKARYESSLANCKKWTEDNMRRYQNQFFISKDRKEICKLLSHSQVLLMYKKSKESKSKDDKLDNTFWKSHARHFLLECRGRVQFIGGKDRRPCITLEPGNIRISVRPNELGASGIEYNKDTKVRFLVAFTLAGPKAEAVIIEG